MQKISCVMFFKGCHVSCLFIYELLPANWCIVINIYNFHLICSHYISTIYIIYIMFCLYQTRSTALVYIYSTIYNYLYCTFMQNMNNLHWKEFIMSFFFHGWSVGLQRILE